MNILETIILVVIFAPLGLALIANIVRIFGDS